MRKFRILAHNVTNNILTTMASVTNNIPDVTSTLSIISDGKKSENQNGLLYFIYVFISDRITIHIDYYLLSLYKI